MKAKRIANKILAFSVAAVLVLLTACDGSRDIASPSADVIQATDNETNDSARELRGCEVIHEQEFGGIYIKITIDDFNALGYQYGDSVTIDFSNGYSLSDIPYYNGFYTRAGESLLIAYPGYEYIKAVVNYGDDLWEIAKLSDNDTATVTLVEAGKYKDIQSARDISYQDEREEYGSDEVFANFRSMKGGKLKENLLYRSASPCNNEHNRAPYVDRLMGDAHVNYIIDLADNEEKIAGYMAADDFNSPNFDRLYKSSNISLLSLNMNFASKEFRSGVVKGLTALAEKEGPFLIHCTEGKDRTGFVCMLIEALCGASYDEIVTDYMITYDNYYQINKENEAEKYEVIVREVLDPMIKEVADCEDVDITTADLSECAKRYLVGLGMSEDLIARLQSKLTES